jgi:hypothetical protein
MPTDAEHAPAGMEGDAMPDEFETARRAKAAPPNELYSERLFLKHL